MSSTPLPAALRVRGKTVISDTGTPMWLQGLAVPSLEWRPDGDNIERTVEVALDDWKANAIRLAVSAEYWFGNDSKKRQEDGGAAYRDLIDRIIARIAQAGAYCIIDLHHYRALRPRDRDFWLDFAKRYAGHPAVLFGLLNEPHSITWDIWRDGGLVDEQMRESDAIPENTLKLERYEAIGFQPMINQIRALGADNPIVVGGLDWGYDLSGVLSGYALNDPSGRGIIYDSHIYPWKSDWQHKTLDIAQHHPVLIGEVGCQQKRMEFIPPERWEGPYTWACDMLACIQRERLHWTAWSFHHWASPCVLMNLDDYRPTPEWGAFVKAALTGGATFTSTRLR